MKKHYQIVDGNIVFNVADEEVVLRELNETLSRAFVTPKGEEHLNLIVELYEEFTDPEDASNNDCYTTLCISDLDGGNGPIIRYTAENPVLVNVDGKFCHYWDFVLSVHTVTDLYDEESDETVGNLEDEIIKAIEKSA